jgi:hypothetical protein
MAEVPGYPRELERVGVGEYFGCQVILECPRVNTGVQSKPVEAGHHHGGAPPR